MQQVIAVVTSSVACMLTVTCNRILRKGSVMCSIVNIDVGLQITCCVFEPYCGRGWQECLLANYTSKFNREALHTNQCSL